MFRFFNDLLDPGVLALLIPLTAVAGAFINKGLKEYYAHIERLAKIEQGFLPEDEVYMSEQEA
jgi:hypothetical protein